MRGFGWLQLFFQTWPMRNTGCSLTQVHFHKDKSPLWPYTPKEAAPICSSFDKNLNYQRTKHCMKTTILYVAYKKNKSYSLDSVLHFCICHSWRSKPHQLCHYVTAYLARLPPFGSVFTFGAGVLGSVLFSASLARFFSAALMWLINGLGWATNRIANSSYKRNSFIQMQHQSIIYIIVYMHILYIVYMLIFIYIYTTCMYWKNEVEALWWNCKLSGCPRELRLRASAHLRGKETRLNSHLGGQWLGIKIP